MFDILILDTNIVGLRSRSRVVDIIEQDVPSHSNRNCII
jgi:hypothetical protein